MIGSKDRKGIMSYIEAESEDGIFDALTDTSLKLPLALIHQSNCVTRNSLGLAREIFTRFPIANIYNDGTKRIPGDILIREISKDCYVIALNGQYYPGNPIKETREMRMRWFKEGLTKIEGLKNLKTIVFPYMIGCGLAGGNWSDYKDEIEQFVVRNLRFQVIVWRCNR